MENREFAETVKSPKKPYKFNITDGFLILIILIAAAVLVYIVAGTGLFRGGGEITVQYTIEIPAIKNEFVEAISGITGYKITDSVRSYDIGEIQRVSISEAFENAIDGEKGVVTRARLPDHSRVLITVRAKAKMDGVKYSINGMIIMVGVQLHFRTQDFMGYGTCIAFDEIKED
jgi:hypothetical protein